MLRVLIADAVHPACAELLRPSCDVVVRPGLTESELIEAVAEDIDVLVVRSAVRVTERVIAAAPRLKLIGRAGAGVDTIDVEAATRKGVVVMNTPGGNAVSTAEHTLALILGCARHITSADRALRAGEWARKRYVGTQLRGKILGVVGLGKVGSEVARLGRAIGMNVIGFDPFLPAEALGRMGVEPTPLDDLFRRAHVVTLHTPLTPETRNLASRERIASMRPGAHLVNCARGGLVDEAALADAVGSGHLAGAAVDVYSVEPPRDSPLFATDRVVTTPHLGASTAEAQAEVARQIARQIEAFARDGTIQNAVNMPSLPGDEAARLAPYLDLTERLARLLAQLADEPIRRLTLSLHGDILSTDTRILTAAAAKGVLAPALTHPVNLVSAPVIARERGIALEEVRSSEVGDFTTLIGLEARTGRSSHAVAGTLFGLTEPRIVRLDEHELDAVPRGPMLLVSNRDEPGVVGILGTILGSHGVNIAAMSLSRGTDGTTARVLLNLDTPASEAVCEALRSAAPILTARALDLD